MRILSIQPKESIVSPIVKRIAQKTKSSNAAKKLSDVALTPWEFEKMINEPKANAVKKYSSSRSSDNMGCAHSESSDVQVIGYDIC